MQHDQALIQHPCHDFLRFRAGFGVAIHQEGLGEFHIPVADLAPDEGIKSVGGVVEAVGVKGGVHLGADAGGLADDPAVDGGCGCGRRGLGRVPLPDAVHFGEAAGVPDLGAEVAIALDPLGREFQHAPQRGHLHHGEAQRIGAEFIDDLQGINDIAARLGHFLSLLVADKLVQVDGVEGHFVHDGQLHHHHAGDPEEQDILPGDQHIGREIARHFRGLLGPAQRADGPEARREPCVQNIGVAGEGLARGHGLRLSLGGGAVLAALIVKPHRDLVTPPELARDAPWLDILKPVVIDLFA